MAYLRRELVKVGALKSPVVLLHPSVPQDQAQHLQARAFKRLYRLFKFCIWTLLHSFTALLHPWFCCTKRSTCKRVGFICCYWLLVLQF